MAFDILAFVALVTLSAAEGASPCSGSSHRRISIILVVVSLVLLCAAGRRAYFLLSFLLSACIVGYGAVRKFRTPSEGSNSNSSSGGGSIRNYFSRLKLIIISRVLPTTLASLFHLFALWILPFAILYGLVDAHSDPNFFPQEIGHLAPATFYVVALVMLPLLVLPKGYENATVQHQLYESIFTTGFSLIYFVIFRTAHHLQGQDPPRMSAPNWDHEYLGLVWFGAGLVGFFCSLQGIRTSVHVFFPAVFVSFSMVSHSNTHNSDMSQEMEGWKMTWMKLHFVHGMLFGLAALCRLLYRIPESMFLFYLGSFAFVTSAQWVVKALDSAVNYADDPESQAAGRYPTEHVVPLLVMAVATALFALFFGTASRLRQFLDMDADVEGGQGAFAAIPTEELELKEGAEGLNNDSGMEEKKDDADEDVSLIV